jgi:hypothetical protein
VKNIITETDKISENDRKKFTDQFINQLIHKANTTMITHNEEEPYQDIHDYHHPKWKPDSLEDILAIPDEEIKTSWDGSWMKEMGGFKTNDIYEETTIDEVMMKHGKKPLINKIATLFSVKQDGTRKTRSVVQWLARIAEKIYGEDLPDAFAPASDLNNFRLILAVEAIMREDINNRRMKGEVVDDEDTITRKAADVLQAFLKGEFKEDDMDYYCYPPTGYYTHFEPRADGHLIIWKLKRPLYGLPISGLRFVQKYRLALARMEITKIDHESCIFYKKDELGKLLLVIGVHVDDNLIVGVKRHVEKFIKDLDDALGVKDLGDPDLHLGIEMTIDEDGDVAISQGRMIRDALEEFGVNEVDDIIHEIHKSEIPSLPMKPDTVFDVPHDLSQADRKFNIRRIVGILIYIMRGCYPVLAIYISLLSSTLHCPMEKWYDLAMGVLKWLSHYKDAGIRFKPDMSRPMLEIKVDAELGGQSKEGKKLRSRGAYLIYCRGMLIAWHSGKHSITSTSSFDTEIRALYSSLEKGLVINKTLKELGLMRRTDPLIVYCDNLATVKVLKNNMDSKKVSRLDFHNMKNLGILDYTWCIRRIRHEEISGRLP